MKRRILFTMTVGLMLFCLTAISHADLFVQIPGIQGEVADDPNHIGWSKALSSSWKHVQPPPGSTVKGVGAPQFSPLTITKEVGTSSAALALFAADARVLSEVILEFTAPVGNNLRFIYQRIRLRNAQLVSYEAMGLGNGPPPSTEVFGLTFTQISWANFGFDASGRPKGSAACWDVIKQFSGCSP